MLAGNRAEDHAGFRQMNSGISSRITHYDVCGDSDVWISDFARPNKINDHIIEYINYKPESLNGIPTENKAWPNPRTWTEASRQMEYLSNLIDSGTIKVQSDKVRDQLLNTIVKSKVGNEISNDFAAYVNLIAQWKAVDIIDGKRKLVDKEGTNNKTGNIYVNSLSPLEAHTLMVACIGEIRRRLRQTEYSDSSKNKDLVQFLYENVIELIIKKHKQIVPAPIKSFITEEKQYKTNPTLSKLILKNKEIVKKIFDIA